MLKNLDGKRLFSEAFIEHPLPPPKKQNDKKISKNWNYKALFDPIVSTMIV